MLVVGGRQLAAQRREEAAEILRLARHGEPVATHADGDVFFGHGAVVVAVAVDARAQVAARRDDRAPDGAAVRLTGGVGHVGAWLGAAVIQRAVEARHAQIAGLAAERVGMHRKARAACLYHRRAAALARRAAQAQLRPARCLLHRRTWDAVVDRVDHAADGAAAVQQRGRAAQHFHALDDERIDGHRVVVAQARCIQRCARVAEHPDAIAVLAADHGAVGVRAKPAR
jgi:hypothetical protein